MHKAVCTAHTQALSVFACRIGLETVAKPVAVCIPRAFRLLSLSTIFIFLPVTGLFIRHFPQSLAREMKNKLLQDLCSGPAVRKKLIGEL